MLNFTQSRPLLQHQVEAHNAVDTARATFHPCGIIEIAQITPDTKTLVLAPRRSEAASTRDWRFGPGQHLIVKRMEPGGGGGYATRSYTPIRSAIAVPVPGRELDVEQAFELLVKVYPDGLLSRHIGGLRVGDDLLCTRAVGGSDVPAGLAVQWLRHHADSPHADPPHVARFRLRRHRSAAPRGLQHAARCLVLIGVRSGGCVCVWGGCVRGAFLRGTTPSGLSPAGPGLPRCCRSFRRCGRGRRATSYFATGPSRTS